MGQRKILLATANKNKIKELLEMFDSKALDLELLTFSDFNFNEDVPETSNTFEGNAFQKANYIYQKFRIPVISDDSGLEIDALNGEPGVFSSRYAGLEKNDANNRAFVLNKLKGEVNRKARFVCCICFFNGKEPLFFEGIINGTIAMEESGDLGFGYDSIFIPYQSQRTFAQYSKEEKNLVSHRALAMAKLLNFFTENPI